MHRIGNKNKTRKKGRAIIIKFTRYNTRKKVFMNIESLKEQIYHLLQKV